MKFTDFEMMRAQDLLVLRASDGLNEHDVAELRKLEASHIDSFDLAAAMVELSVEHDEAMPDDIAAKILHNAFAQYSDQPSGRVTAMENSTAPAIPSVAAVLTASVLPAITTRPTSSIDVARQKAASKKIHGRQSVIAYSGWAVAAAAASVALWSFTKRNESPTAPGVTPAAAPAVSASIANSSDVVTVALTGFHDANVAGSLRWSPTRQTGELSLTGLSINTPSANRYQLWIFDTNRDERFPVDAGLFDVTGATTTFSFTPRITVGHAGKFMVTLENANGAVVSDRNQTIIVSR